MALYWSRWASSICESKKLWLQEDWFSFFCQFIFPAKSIETSNSCFSSSNPITYSLALKSWMKKTTLFTSALLRFSQRWKEWIEFYEMDICQIHSQWSVLCIYQVPGLKKSKSVIFISGTSLLCVLMCSLCIKCFKLPPKRFLKQKSPFWLRKGLFIVLCLVIQPSALYLIRVPSFDQAKAQM